MEGTVDKGTNNYSQTLTVGHASPEKTPWRSLGQCKSSVESYDNHID